MRLDKLVGKAKTETNIEIYSEDDTLLYIINNAIDFKEHRKILKRYKVVTYEIFNFKLIVYVKERKNG